MCYVMGKVSKDDFAAALRQLLKMQRKVHREVDCIEFLCRGLPLSGEIWLEILVTSLETHFTINYSLFIIIISRLAGQRGVKCTSTKTQKLH